MPGSGIGLEYADWAMPGADMFFFLLLGGGGQRFSRCRSASVDDDRCAIFGDNSDIAGSICVICGNGTGCQAETARESAFDGDISAIYAGETDVFWGDLCYAWMLGRVMMLFSKAKVTSMDTTLLELEATCRMV